MKKLPPASSTPSPISAACGEASTPVASSLERSTPPSIPDHELLRRIGGGSYGEVWLARSVMGTYRAVKIVHRHTFDHDRPFEREFAGIQKFEPISRSHEGLVDLLQVGRNEAEGYFYYVMELADDARRERSNGVVESWSNEKTSPTQHSSTPALQDPSSYCPKTLRSLLRPSPQPSTINPQPNERLPLDECIQLGLSLTNALAYLHGQGLVHRDIKPSNIIFVGVPKLADVGLVTGVDEARSYVGTEGFIPPEGPGTPQADLYSLGILLYQMSTGKSHQDFPEPLHDLAAQPDHTRLLELNAVIHKACRSETRERYQTAEKMHADLELLCAGQSVKRLHLVERRLALLTRVSTLVALLAIIAAGFSYQTIRAQRIATQNVVRLHVATGTRQMTEGDLFGSLLSFTEALRLDRGDASRKEAHRIRIASVLRQCPKLIGVFEHERPINEAILSPDGHWLLTGSDDHTAKVWDLASGTNHFTLLHKGPVFGVGFSPDGSVIVTTSSDQQAHLWSAMTGETLRLPPIRHLAGWSGIHLRFSPDGRRLLTWVEANTLQSWNVTTGEPIGQPLRHAHDVTFFTFSPDGRYVASSSADNQARVWDSLTGELRFSFPHGGYVHLVSFSPDSHVLATSCGDGQVRLWDLSSGALQPTPLEHRSGVDAVTYSPDGSRLLTRCEDGSVQVWDIKSRKPLTVPITHNIRVFQLAFTPDGRGLATCSGGNLLQLRDTDTGQLKIAALRHGGWRDPIVISSDGRLVATLYKEEARVWDIGIIEPRPLPIKPVASFTQSSISPNGRFKVRIGGDNTVRTIDLKSHESLPQLAGLVPPIRQAFFSPDSEILITENSDSRARAWNPASGEPLTPLLKTEYSLNARRISKLDLPRSNRLVAESVQLAELLSGNRIDETGGSRPLEVSESLAHWKSLRAASPEAFRASPDGVFHWHEQEARACEQDWNWWSAIFHLNWLIANKPEDASLRDRRAYAQMALAKANQVQDGYLQQVQAIPPRNPSASAEMVDLSGYYNVSLRKIGATWPNGLQTFAGTAFDVRGIIKLLGLREKACGGNYPEQVTGIAIGRKCNRLYFLHAADWRTKEAARVGTYVVHYADRQARAIPIVYGQDVRDWWTQAEEPLTTQQSSLAWMGNNPEVQYSSRALRVFKSTWENPFPNDQVESIDLISEMSEASPFVVAITAE